MKAGLIGCGWVVERGHAPALRQVPELEIVATADPAGDRARHVGQLFGVAPDSCYTDYHRLLERSDVKVVSVATPPATHRAIVTTAAEAGKHVICEKPIATTLADADAMIAACQQHRVLLAVYHNYLYYPETRLAADLIGQGAIGEVVATEFNGLGLRFWSGAQEYRPGWRLDARQSGGGAFMDAGVHAVYLTELYHGRPITAVHALMRRGETGVDTLTVCQLDLSDRVGLINVGWGQGHVGLHIVGTAGHLAFVYDEWSGFYGNVVRAIRQCAQDQPTVTHYLPTPHETFPPQLYRDLLRGISGESPLPATGEQGRRALEVTLATYKSAAVGALIALPLARQDPVYQRGWAALHDAG